MDQLHRDLLVLLGGKSFARMIGDVPHYIRVQIEQLGFLMQQLRWILKEALDISRLRDIDGT
jgi:hypothetical protein